MRYLLPDTLRGILLLSMMTYHTSWDLLYLFDRSLPWIVSGGGYIWQQSICWGFILLSGFCMGMRPLDDEGCVFAAYKRGLIILTAGMLVSGVTLAAVPETPVIFGILFFLGSAILLTVRLRKAWDQVLPAVGLAVSGAAFLLLRNINIGTVGFEELVLGTIPETLYEKGLAGAFLGFPGKEFTSSDYFSLFPWYFLFLTGFFFCRLRPPIKSERLLKWGNTGLAALGRRSLTVYLLHQPVILALLYLLLN